MYYFCNNRYNCLDNIYCGWTGKTHLSGCSRIINYKCHIFYHSCTFWVSSLIQKLRKSSCMRDDISCPLIKMLEEFYISEFRRVILNFPCFILYIWILILSHKSTLSDINPGSQTITSPLAILLKGFFYFSNLFSLVLFLHAIRDTNIIFIKKKDF